VDSPGSGKGPLVSCCECGDEPSVYGAMELVICISSNETSGLPAGSASLIIAND
jgi:hypothetical protein